MRRTSVSSNFVLAVACPSAIEVYQSSDGCPTIEADVSRCWCVIHSLYEDTVSHQRGQWAERAE